DVSSLWGSGNGPLASTGGSGVTLFSGSGNDSLMATGGTNITLFGGIGNDTLTAIGVNGGSLFCEDGNNTYVIGATPANPINVVLNDLNTIGQNLDQIDG